MAQAAKIIPFPRWDEKHAESFRDLESDICDLSLMAKLATREVAGVLESLSDADPEHEGYDRATFAVGHVLAMIEALKAKYYAEFAAARS